MMMGQREETVSPAGTETCCLVGGVTMIDFL